MYTFLDHYDNEYGAIATIEVTSAVNGEKSIKGEIYSNDNVLHNIDKGWRLRFQDEYFVITYAKPKDVGNKVQVSFDAVHQFFWDFSKLPANEQLTDGSHTFQAYLEFIFKDTGYRYSLEQNAKAFEKQSFGYKSKLALFNDVISTAGLEFQVNGKVVRILEKTGTDLSTVVRKNFNMNDLTIEKNIDGFITYQKGFGAWNDKDDHSKGRLEVEYESPLAKKFGRLGGEPVVDERYTDSQSLLSVLRSNVENSYTISVQIDMEDLTRAGYRYDQPVAGDYIMAINETLGFQEKIRIVSYTSQYDAKGTLISHKVTCNDIGSVKKQSSSYARLSKSVNESNQQIQDALIKANNALVTADGKNTSYFGTEFPEDVPKGTLTKGDIFYRTVGDRTLMYFWNGIDWEDNPVINDTEEFKRSIDQQFEDFNTSYDEAKALQDQQIADVLAKAGSAEDLANQAKTDAASAVQRSSQLKAEAVAEANRLVQAQGTALTEQIQSVDVRVDDVANQVSSKVSQIDFDAVKKTVESNSTEITQNQSAIELKADKTVTDALATTVNQTKSELKITSDAVATKVSKTDFDATNQRLATAETTIRTQAGQIEQRLTSTQVESAINAKGYQTKAQVDNNITGRGYITDSALQPYALSTTVQNLVKETADSFSRTISETKALIPTSAGSVNYIRDFGFADSYTFNRNESSWRFERIEDGTARSGYHIKATCTQSGGGGFHRVLRDLRGSEWRGRTMTYSVDVKASKSVRMRLGVEAFSRGYKAFDVTTDWQRFISTDTVNLKTYYSFPFYTDSVQWQVGDVIYLRDPQLEDGSIATTAHAAEEDLATVTALHSVSDTVDSHTRTISEQGESISQVIQTANGLITRIDNLSAGVRNYLANTAKPSYIVVDNVTGYRVFDWYKFVSGKTMAELGFVVGDRVTLQYDLGLYSPRSGTTSVTNYRLEFYNATGYIARFGDIYVPEAGSKKITIELTSAMLAATQIRLRVDDSNTVLEFNKTRLVKGSMSVDWSPAPEDSDTAVQAVSTQVSQLAGSWAVKNLTSNGAVLNQINLLANGTNRIDGRLTHITGQTLIDNGVIKSAMIGNAQINTAHIGTIDAGQANIININASNITSGTITGINMRGGALTSLNGAVNFDLQRGHLNFLTSEATMRRQLAGYPTQFIKFDTGSNNGTVTVIGSNRGGNENPNDGNFAGIRIWNDTTSDGFYDYVDVAGDVINFTHKVVDGGTNTRRGWEMKSYGIGSDVSLRPIGYFSNAHITATEYRILNKSTNSYKDLSRVLDIIFDNFRNISEKGGFNRSYYSNWR